MCVCVSNSLARFEVLDQRHYLQKHKSPSETDELLSVKIPLYFIHILIRITRTLFSSVRNFQKKQTISATQKFITLKKNGFIVSSLEYFVLFPFI